MKTRPDKLKVLHLITHAAVGGAQDNTYCTCERHDRGRYEVHLGCSPAGGWSERAKQSCDVFHPLPDLVTPIRPLQDLCAFFALVRLLRREKFDLVHTHTAKAGFLGRLAAGACRVPLVVHTYHAFPFHDFMSAGKRWLYVLLERLAGAMTDFVITLSEQSRQEAMRLKIAPAHAAQVVYTGIDFEKLDHGLDRAAVRARLNLNPDQPVVILVGRLDPAKAPHLMVEAFRKVLPAHPDAVLLLAGDGDLRGAIEDKVRSLGLEQQVRLLGTRRDVPDLLRAADVFAFSSLWEAMGRALVEAMLLGRAVVAPAIYGIPEIVHHQETGLLYEVGNVEQLADGLRKLLDHPGERARLGAGAQRLTRHLFDVRQMVVSIEEIYERLLNPAAAKIVPLPGWSEAEEPVAMASGSGQ